jgi:hypothetical protein
LRNEGEARTLRESSRRYVHKLYESWWNKINQILDVRRAYRGPLAGR